MSPSVVTYALDRLADLGIGHVFGVPGDYAFPINDAVEVHPRLQWVPSANELNAAYAADGYARRRGAGIVCTTYGVGELSALNGLMGAMAERLPVFHLVGTPSQRIVRQGLICHHTLGDQTYDRFEAISASASCVSARLTPENAVIELERVIDKALEESKPAYLTFPMDLALMPITGKPIQGSPIGQVDQHASVSRELEAVLDLLEARIGAASNPVVLPTITLKRFGLVPALERFLEASGLAYATTPMDKSLLSEDHPAFLGMYNGHRSTPASLGKVVEEADLLLDLGGLVLEDLNTGLWSGSLDSNRLIAVHADWVQAGHQVFTSVSISDVLAGLTERLRKASPSLSSWGDQRVVQPAALLPLSEAMDQPTDSASFYPLLQRFLRPTDLLVSDTGTCLLKLNSIRLPAGVAMESQTLWSSIGWGTPSALGCALAEPERRVVLVTGDGAHQLTMQEIGVMGFTDVKPVVIVLNNGLYGVEALISETGHAYNDLPPWRYAEIPSTLGCEGWWCGRAATVAELEEALTSINAHQGAAYLEVVIPAEESQPLEEEVIETMHQTMTPDSTSHN
ncbi:alpha-keto acid decarboxylase family protein [Synechococcus sp. KORDI-52]|uniref:alpha-keto acid decarboxylase family protein n=1 Tax=Synechococcus sp. KORDI-52 TaxID=585425 RepID=UPI00057004F0|nr:thiamine pyrophosphate-binding protein [Synechococcus sp. KORDI-52]